MHLLFPQVILEDTGLTQPSQARGCRVALHIGAIVTSSHTIIFDYGVGFQESLIKPDFYVTSNPSQHPRNNPRMVPHLGQYDIFSPKSRHLN